LNLGGMANLTILRAPPARTLAFDTGPAGSLLDGLARALFDRPYDAGGELAARGTPDETLLRVLADHPFFERAPPKSTGRDTFGEAWVRAFLERARPANERARCDLLATAVEHVAWGVAHGLERFVPERVSRLVVAGGGVHHAGLMRALARRTRAECLPSDVFGVPAKAREALVFAVLAARTVLGLAVTEPSATGARRGRRLGKFSPAACVERAPDAAANPT
jgi:anhydro-N-acetylmuramic acid kinase